MSQSYTLIDPAGNQAQYTVYDADRDNEYCWSTDHGDSGSDGSFARSVPFGFRRHSLLERVSFPLQNLSDA
jgi:hypothetical protein